MKISGKIKIIGKNLLIAVFGGMSSLIFPPFSNAFIGYIALVLFLSYLFSRSFSLKELFFRAYTFGFAFYAVGYSWICQALLVDDKFVAYVPLVLVTVGAFFALFWAVPAMVIKLGKNVYAQMLLFSSAFVIMEWVRSFIFTGFPWNLLGTALSFDVRLIQGASYIGTYGLSFMLLILCLGLSLLCLSIWHKKIYRGSLLFLLVPSLFFLFAALRSNEKCTDCSVDSSFIVRLVQPSIPQTFKWNPALLYKNFRQYIDLSKKGHDEKGISFDNVRLVVWGEAATPYLLDRDERHLQEIKEAIPKGGFLVTGLLRLGLDDGQEKLYNSLFVINSDGVIKDYYDKSHLVPFGEYLPFRRYLPDFMHPVAQVVSGDLGQGQKYKNIKVSGLPLMGGAICYESIFPKEVVNSREKPDILLVLANDGWYGVSAGPYQHLAAAQMRAVEEGITVIRSANTGISAVINANGVVLGTIGLNVVGVKDVSLPLPFSKTTFYGKYGNIIIFILLLLCLLVGLFINRFCECVNSIK